MRGKSKALPLTANLKIKSVIKNEIVKGSLPQKFAKRLGFILDGIDGKSIYSTMARDNVAFATVHKWRQRWESSVPELITFCEHGVKNKPAKDGEIFEKILAVLSDEHRIGTPKRITIDQEEKIRALACCKPTDYGIEYSNWTRETLAQVSKSLGIVDQISGRYVSKILKKKA
jgi:hypothetical protein